MSDSDWSLLTLLAPFIRIQPWVIFDYLHHAKAQVKWSFLPNEVFMQRKGVDSHGNLPLQSDIVDSLSIRTPNRLNCGKA
jgi:hypothetical protein